MLNLPAGALDLNVRSPRGFCLHFFLPQRPRACSSSLLRSAAPLFRSLIAREGTSSAAESSGPEVQISAEIAEISAAEISSSAVVVARLVAPVSKAWVFRVKTLDFSARNPQSFCRKSSTFLSEQLNFSAGKAYCFARIAGCVAAKSAKNVAALRLFFYNLLFLQRFPVIFLRGASGLGPTTAVRERIISLRRAFAGAGFSAACLGRRGLGWESGKLRHTKKAFTLRFIFGFKKSRKFRVLLKKKQR